MTDMVHGYESADAADVSRFCCHGCLFCVAYFLYCDFPFVQSETGGFRQCYAADGDDNLVSGDARWAPKTG